MTRRVVTYVTSNPAKRLELEAVLAQAVLLDGTRVNEAFEFRLERNTIQETLEVNLGALVHAEALAAYTQLKRPCIVEHAGLIFSEYKDEGYPGGLTKPMWDTLGENFLKETNSRGREVLARAAIGYCDGRSVEVFYGETKGTLSDEPRGPDNFYWDTIFIPDGSSNPSHLTYAEIVARDGLDAKVMGFSQSRKAMLAFLEWRVLNEPSLWNVTF